MRNGKCFRSARIRRSPSSPGHRWPKGDWPANRPKNKMKRSVLRPMPSANVCTLDEDLTIAQRVSDVAEARKLPMAQVALAWMLSKPVITAPIIGATKPHHLEDAVAAVSVQSTPGGDPPFGRSISSASHTRLCVICQKWYVHFPNAFSSSLVIHGTRSENNLLSRLTLDLNLVAYYSTEMITFHFLNNLLLCSSPPKTPLLIFE